MRRPALAFAVACAVLVGAAAAAARELSPLELALRRAAFELSAGRPDAAADAVAHLAPARAASERDERDDWAQLLRAEGEILDGDAASASARLEALLDSASEFVRAQAAAHRLALVAVAWDAGGDSLRAAAQAALIDWERTRRGKSASVDLVAAWVATRLRDPATETWWERARRDEAAPAAALVAGERALAAGDAKRAAKQFESLADTDAAVWQGWARAWGAVGVARARLVAGDAADARARLARVEGPAELRAQAQWLSAQWAYAAGDSTAVAAALRALELDPVDAFAAAEARLLALQAALDRGAFAAAESLAAAVEAGLHADLTTQMHALELDLTSWHAARAGATLQLLAERNVLRRMPQPTQLAPAPSAYRIVDAAPHAATAPRLVLHGLVMREPEATVTAAARAAARRAATAVAWRRLCERRWDRAAARLVERETLLARARAALDEIATTLGALEGDAAALRAGFAAHAARLAAAEAAWRRLLEQRVAALEMALVELRRAETKLAARYPEDRSVRSRPETAQARAGVAGTLAWVAQAESLHAHLDGRIGDRVRAVLAEHELGADAAKLDSLDAMLAAARVRAAALARALGEADAGERMALARAGAAVEAAARDAALAGEIAQRTATEAEATRVARAAAYRAAYAEAAQWGGASAAFHAALAVSPGDTTRLAQLRRAATRLDAFARAWPQSVSAAEALYRLGDVHLQRAALQYQSDLAAFLAAGGRAESAPLPVENYADALAAYRQLIDTHPASARAHDALYSLGFVLAEMGSLEASSEALDRFLAGADSSDTRAGRAALRLGDNRLLQDDRNRALAAFRIAAAAADGETRDLGLFKQGWCAYDLDHHDESRAALQALLERAVHADSAQAPRAAQLAPETLELLALAFAADHDARGAALVLDEWGRPVYDFAVLRRMTQLFASRALYDEAIAGDELLLERHPHHPALPAVAEDLLHWLEVRRGAAAAHARAAELASRFAPDSEWARAMTAAGPAAADPWRPRTQSRLVEEDAAAARADSLVQALADPRNAAARMAQRMRAAAVYEHRREASDSLSRQATLGRAASLYERTLTQFPGAEDEATTHLYLGEARYELGAFEPAADAYGHAAAHAGADSSLRHTAAGQELAALDAAAASRPQAVLDRYEDTTQRFAGRYPQDPRSVDAFERIGDLGFAAQDWERSDRGYAEVAARTPDAKRAATASKLRGDVAWQREDYAQAAERYDAALARARAARADTLAQALERLVPASLYRAAEVHEQKGERKAAARGFEAVAVQHPRFEFADRALYRAGGLHAAAGDSAAAVSDFARLVRDHPQSELHADAWLEWGRCQEASRDRGGAARTFSEFAARYPRHAQATPARLRAGMLFASTQQPAAADSQYAVVLETMHPQGQAPRDAALAGDLWLRRARLAAKPAAAAPHYRRALDCASALPPGDRAEAHFQIAEAARPAYQAVPLTQPVTVALQKKQQAVEPLLQGYARAANEKVTPWHAAACLRLGETLVDLGNALRTSEPPSTLEGDDLYAYQESLAQQAIALEDRAVEAWSSGLGAARAAKHQDDWTRAIEKRLFPALASRVPTRPMPLFVLVDP